MITKLLVVISVTIAISTKIDFYDVALGHQSLSMDLLAQDFPEMSDSSLLARPSTAISFSGGGSRSYIATLGILSALDQLGN